MRFRFRKVVPLRAEFDMTPLIDCVFNLLIFFMLTSSYIIQPGIRINLPKALTSEVIHDTSLIVTVTKENLIILNENAVTLEDLAVQFEKAAKDNTPLLIRADRHAALGKVVEIWDLCRDVGLTKVNIATIRGE